MSSKGNPLARVCLIVIGVVICLALIVGSLVFYFTAGAAKAGDRFLTLLGEGKAHEAYLSTSSALRAQVGEDEFTDVVKELGLTEYASSDWDTRSVGTSGVATLQGTVTTRAGGRIPLKLQFVKEQGEWKVSYVSGSEAGMVIEHRKRDVPSEETLRRMTKEALLDFNQAIKAKDFKPFHDKIAALWKREVTPEGLQKTFQKFIDLQVDIGGIQDVNPVFDKPPALDDNGSLAVSGYYPTKPLQVTFNLDYTYEHPAWKLIGIRVKVKD
jgi:hypothetical protein